MQRIIRLALDTALFRFHSAKEYSFSRKDIYPTFILVSALTSVVYHFIGSEFKSLAVDVLVSTVLAVLGNELVAYMFHAFVRTVPLRSFIGFFAVLTMAALVVLPFAAAVPFLPELLMLPVILMMAAYGILLSCLGVVRVFKISGAKTVGLYVVVGIISTLCIYGCYFGLSRIEESSGVQIFVPNGSPFLPLEAGV